MRLFIAIEFPDRINKILDLQKSGIKKLLPEARITNSNHLTLIFLGELKDPDEVIERLETIEEKSFNCTLGQLGIFKNPSTSIVWMSLESEQIKDLNKKIHEKLEDLQEVGQKHKPQREFKPHITLARLKRRLSDQESELLKRNIDRNQHNLNTPSFEITIDKFSLIRSTLAKEGPVYETIREFQLTQ